ncbi:MAG TPA: D-alanyl-D-alanine carboxypeptidase/D-alanyl-D-alanine-endopeptidase [Phycisphaerae bacterium]|nr:D-alanyl-D-alanine carboxypeptidase/D-alanyl-D-alanine-endopeptidase [Phycisphaerae bacterium]
MDELSYAVFSLPRLCLAIFPARRPRSTARAALALVVFLLAASPLCGAAPPALPERIAAAVADYETKQKGVVGVSVVDLRTGKTVMGQRDGERFVPASNQKLLTGALALARLGGDFKFVTAAYLVNGDLWVVGSGDPTFGDPVLAKENKQSIYAELDRWAASIKKASAEGIAGNLIVCACFDPNQRSPLEGFRHPAWPKRQHDKWYCAPAAGLNFHDNCFGVTFANTAGKITPVLTPASSLIQIVNKTKVAKRHLWWLSSSADDSVVTFRGTVKTASPYPLPVAVNNPPLLFGRVLADRLDRAKVALKGGVVLKRLCPLSAPELRRPVCRTLTPLAAAMRRMNKDSLNMVAECVFLRAGDGTWRGSARIMTETLARSYGLDPGSFTVSDGGGLSQENRVSPAAMSRLLAAVAKRKDAAVFLQSLSVSGTDGTLRKRLTDKAYRGRIRAKSGYVLGACALSGYVLSKEDRPAMAFSILVNRVPPGKAWVVKQLQDAICCMLVDSLGGR